LPNTTDKPDKVVQLVPPQTDTSADELLEELKGKLKYVLVIGWGNDAEESFYVGSNSGDLREGIYACEMYKHISLSEASGE
jgi:hypothetical protein